MKRIVGIVLLVLAVLFGFSALMGMGQAPNVSYLVGTFMPALVCAILGLYLVQAKPK